MVTSEKTLESTPQANRDRTMAIAFVIGALVHAVLLGLSLSGLFNAATSLLLVFAFPGAIVDMSAEIFHPSPFGGVVLAVVATVVNGSAYALGAWMVSQIRKRF